MPSDIARTAQDADRVIIVMNPTRQGTPVAARVDELAGLLTQRGFRVETLTDLAEMARQANSAYAQGSLRALVAVGGDGTAAELVNRTAPGVPLALFPSGNENLLARHLHLGRSPEECCQLVSEGKTLQLDAGRAGGRIFLLMAGCGFDADVVQRVHARRKGRVSRGTYVWPTLQSLRDYEYPELRIYWSDAPDREPAGPPLCCRWAFVFNLPCYGGGLNLAPRADGANGLLDVCTFRKGGALRTLGYAAAVLCGQHRRLADFSTRRAARLRITSESPVPYQLDGDPGGMLPVEIELLPKRLTLLHGSSK